MFSLDGSFSGEKVIILTKPEEGRCCPPWKYLMKWKEQRSSQISSRKPIAFLSSPDLGPFRTWPLQPKASVTYRQASGPEMRTFKIPVPAKTRTSSQVSKFQRALSEGGAWGWVQLNPHVCRACELQWIIFGSEEILCCS